MLDHATENLRTGMEFIIANPSYHEGQTYYPFFHDAAKLLDMTKLYSSDGRHAGDVLQEIEHQMILIKHSLLYTHDKYDEQLADYLANAIQEVNVARYIETYEHHEV